MKMRSTVLMAAGALSLIALGSGCAKDSQNDAMNREDGRLAAARAKFEESERKPISADTRFAAGQLAEGQGDIGNAIAQYQAALKINPKHAASLFRMACIYTGQRNFDEAIETWRRFIAATNNGATGYSNLGFCYELAGRPTDAETAYKTGITREPTNQACRVNYGLMLARQGKLDLAQAQLAAVLQPAEVHYDIASVLEAQNKTADAKAEYRKALEIDPNMADAQARLAALE